jgi:hypothetical protein
MIEKEKNPNLMGPTNKLTWTKFKTWYSYKINPFPYKTIRKMKQKHKETN